VRGRALSILALLPLLVGFELLRSPNKAVETGNARMKAGKAEEALAEYDKAVKALPTEPGAHFDRGAALYALGRFDEAREEFLRATEAKATPLKAAAFYNLGNSFFKTEKYGDAIAAYRRALLLDPNDVRAKWNLELALKKKKEEDQKNKDKNKDQDQDKKDDQEKQDQKDDKQDQEDKQDDKQSKQDQKQQDQKDQKQQDQKQQDEEQQQKQEEQAKQDEKEQKPQPKPEETAKKDGAKNEPQPKPEKEKAADMKEIEAVLDGLERSPKDLEKERARLRAVRRAAPSKDW
jgi:Ca-activated chloride channel family protein